MACCLIGGAGIVLVVAGSFLPWVISGTVRRSSYAIVGILDRLGIADDGPIGILVGAWPLIGVLCMTPVVAAVLRWWRASGVLAVLLAVAAGLLSFGVDSCDGRPRRGRYRGGPDRAGDHGGGRHIALLRRTGLALGAGSPVRRGLVNSARTVHNESTDDTTK